MFRTKPYPGVTRLEGNPALAAWPVNSIFFGYTSTNPATLLGGGTWSQIAQGKMLVGQNPSDTDFDVLGDTGGSKTHMQTTIEVATHAHYPGSYGANGTGAGHTHNFVVQYAQTTTTGGTAYRVTDVAGSVGGGGSSTTASTNSTGASHTHGVDGQSGDVVGFTGQQAMNIMNPFLVVYIWRRTA